MFEPIVPEGFDWQYYLEANPDVARYPFYNSEKGALSHWKKHGHSENRKYRVDKASLDSVKFSIVIPTMWRSSLLKEMLTEYQKSEKVGEIIIIDNSPESRYDLSEYSKVVYLTKGENIYVNPAWNWGASVAKHTLVLANDDIAITELDHVLCSMYDSGYDIVGVSQPYTVLRTSVRKVESFPANYYGCFMMVRKYTYIPNQLKIWYGDNILFDSVKSRGVLKTPHIRIDKSQTINSDVDLFRRKVGANDIKEYEKLISSKETFNIIIRTSNRPFYFENCIRSIRQYRPDAKLHITIDDEKDLEYVQETVKGLTYSYYLIDREVIEKFSRKVKITRNFFPYNSYFNVVKPFLRGWNIFLDDDDELMNSLSFPKHQKNIYLFKVQVGNRIVPSTSNFGNPPILNDISGLGIMFHHTQMEEWLPQRGGDYSFISALYMKHPTVWQDIVISKTQTKGNFGNRKDLTLKDKRVSVNIATYPAREEHFKKVIKALLEIPLIDIIRVYLNEYKTIPESFPRSPKLKYEVGGADLKDSGKFYWAHSTKEEYYFTADDDLIYSEEYFQKHLNILRRYKGEVFVTSHGKVMREFPKAFNDCTESYRCLEDREEAWVNNGGTGVMVFDNSKYIIPRELFKYHGMTDLWIGIYCQQNKIPIISREHRASELVYTDPKDTLFEQRDSLAENHKKALSTLGMWKLYTIP